MSHITQELLTIAIVNYNTSAFIGLSLSALHKLTKNEYNVIICDNGSSLLDKRKIKRIAEKYHNVELLFRNQSDQGSIGHGEALNILIKKMSTPYGVILDADATFLMKGWDDILIDQLNNKEKIIGAPPVENPIKATDFPSVYVVLFDTRVFKALKIDLRPKNPKIGQDTGWEMREKFLKNGYTCKILETRSTRDYKDGPFRNIICAEYYLEGYNGIFASHFGRGATLGTAKYKEQNLLFSIPGINQIAKRIKGLEEKKEWLGVCEKIIESEAEKEVYSKDKYEYVKCDLCGRDDTEPVLIGKDLYNNIPGEFRVVKCKNCNFVYTNPRPFGKELLRYYPDDAGYFIPASPENRAKKLNGLKENVWNKLLAAYWGYSHLSKVNRVEKVCLYPLYLFLKRSLDISGFPRFHQDGKLLEVGCSYGPYLKQMKELGWEVLGIEPNQKAADFGSKEFGVRIINDTFENVEFNDEFDVIAFKMVLEHVPNPSKIFEKSRELLNKNGKLIIIVPDFSGIESRLFKEYHYALQVPCHLNHFTPSTIRGYCKKYGFKVDKIIHHTFDRDFVASAQYMKNDGTNRWLAPILSNKRFRKTILRAAVVLLSYLGITSRMTIWVRKDE